MDVKTVFLNRNLEEEVYMNHSEGFSFKGKEHMVCKLKKSLYRLKQVSQQWYLTFNEIIVTFRIVHDILLAINDLCLLHHTKRYLSTILK